MKNFTKSLSLVVFFSLLLSQTDTFAQAPGNDLICNATTLSVGVACTQGTNVNATSSGTPPAGTCWNPATSNNDVWYSFVATAINMTVSTDFTGLTLNNTQVAIYSSSSNTCTGTLTQVGCGENGGTNVGNNSLTNLSLLIGNTYFVRVEGNTNAVGTFCISAAETYTPGSTPCQAQIVTPNSGTCSNLNGNLATNTTAPAASYHIIGADYGGCDNETNQVGTWTTFVANSTSVTLRNQSGGARDYTFFDGSCNSPTWISCTSVANNAQTIFSNLTVGVSYYILTTAQNGLTTTNVNTTFCLTNTIPCTPPANDNCADAMAITAGVLYTVTNYCAGSDDPPLLCSGTTQNNIWFTWACPANWTGQAFFQLFNENCRDGNTSSGMQCSVYVPGVVCGSADNCVAVSNTVTTNNINVAWTPTPGSTYLINYDGYSGEVCSMNFEITNTVSVVVISVNSPTICAGDTATLTASSTATGYLWSTGATTQSIRVSPTSTTSYTVSATVGGTGSAISTVTVNPIPGAPTAGSNSPICAGATLNLTASTIANATYSWTGPGGFTSTAQNPVVPGAVSGIYSVTAKVLTCTSAPGTTTVVVNAIPAAPTAGSNSPVCSGGTVSLTASTIPNATYHWTGPNGFTSSLQNPTIPNATTGLSGTYSVTDSVAGCPSSAGTTVVTVNSAPGAPSTGSNSPVCEGGVLSLTVTTIPSATYSWTGPNGFTSTLQNPFVSGVTSANAGIYGVVATTSGCLSDTGKTTVVINPIPAAPVAANTGPVCEGQTLAFTADTIPGATYSWTGPNGFTSNLQNPAINNATTAASGTYSVAATVAGCTGPAGTTTAVVNQIPVPVVTSNSPICAGATLNLNATFFANATYNWGGPNGFTSTLQNPSIPNTTIADSGIYYVYVRAKSCVSTQPAGVRVIINETPAPAAGSNSPVCSGATLNLTASGSPGVGYSWTGPNGFASNVQNPSITSVTTAASGTYYVAATLNGCSNSVPDSVVVIVNPTPGITAGNNGPLCEGSDLELTASNFTGASYSWTGPNGFTSLQQNPTIFGAGTADSGTYSVTATATGCSSTAPATTNAIINPIPPVPSPGSNSPLCEGDNLNLTSTTVPNAAYSWTGPNGYTAAVQNPTISNIAVADSGDYNIEVTVNGCTSSSATVHVVVNPIPAAPSIGSNSPICEGGPINLTAGNVNGGTFDWTGPNGFTSILQSPSIPASTVADSGTYYATTTVSECTSASASTLVIVYALPPSANAGSNSPVCTGDTLFLTADNIPGASYSWTGTNGFTSSDQNPVIPNATTSDAATYTVVATLNNCSGPASQVTVIINQNPTASFTSTAPVCLGKTVDFTNTGSTGAGYSFAWSFGADATPDTSILENPTGILYATQGTKSVTLTITNANCVATATQNISIVGAPVADFTNDGPACFPPGIVTFTDASTGNPTSYSWDFGAGATPATSTSAGPIPVTYSTQGSKTIMLTVSAGGCSSTTTKNADVGVVGADFTSSVPQNGDNGCLAQPVNFYNIGSTGSGATHYWNFGTGAIPATSTDENPVGIIYTNTGAKTVLHIVTAAACGIADTVTHIITINPIPVTTFTSTAPVCANTPVDFRNTGSTGVNYSFFWDFGAGASPSTSIAENPSGVTYSFSGTKTVTFSITNQFYCVVLASQNITINSTPVAAFSTNAPQCTGLPVNFANTGTTSGVSWSWSFDTGALPATSTDQSPAGIIYSTAGIKVINLTATDSSSGCTASANSTITINQSPTASFTTNAPQCSNVGFDFHNTGSTGSNWSYNWNFGTGANPATSSGENATGVLYSSPGTKTVTFTISGQGCTQTSTQSIGVSSAPTAGFTSTAPQCTGLPVNFTNTGTTSGVTYLWNLGAGATPPTSTDQNPAGVTYSTSGTKTITLVTTDTLSGCTATSTSTININLNPTATFTTNAPQCSTVPIDFTNTGSTGGSWSYSWNFGTGASPAGSSAESPTGIQYGTAGTKTVTFTISGNGCTQTSTQNIVINATPAASFTSNAPQCTGLPVDFSNTGTLTGVSWSWNLGGAATPPTSTDASPTGVVYSAPGIKSVTLTVTDTTSGCSVTASSTFTIYQSPVATFTSTAPQCSTVGIDFTNTGSTGGSWSYNWNLGTGAVPSFSSAENPSGVMYSSSGTKTITFTVSDQHCTQTSTQSITINATPTSGFTTTGPQCTGLGVDFNNTGSATGVSYTWNFGSGATPATDTTNPNPSGVIYSTPGTKTITLTTTDTVSGCSVTASNTITIYQSPTATFTSTAPQCSTVGINFTNTGSTGGSWSYNWNLGQDANPIFSSAENPSGIMYGSSGVKTVTFTVSDQHCVQTATQNITINATPTVAFTTTAPQCTGLPVDFNSTGTTTNVAWSWDFGSGATPATDTIQSPAGVIYSSAGTKTVTLTATDTTSGCSVAATHTFTIHQTPTVSFTSNAPQCSTVGINFTNTGSTGGNWSYNWNFGQGAIPAVSTAENPSGVMYSSSGTKTVTFTISDQSCTQTSTQTITIQPTPVAAFTSTAPECTGLPIDFTNTGSSAGVAWAWNFGSGATPATSAIENPSAVVYSTAGTKTVTLTTTDSVSGCSVTVNTTINIHQTPTSSFTSTAPQCAGVGIDFTNTGSNGGSWSYNWNFGVGASPATSTGENPSGVMYSSGGVKTVTFTITGQYCTQTSTQTITINETPIANFTSTAPVCTGLPVNFTNTGTSTGVTWAWNFGTGASPATDIVENPTGVIYPTAGIKTITLTITNTTTNCAVVATSTINIYQTPTATFTSTAPQCANSPINFTNTGSTGGNWSFAWDFGQDGNPVFSSAENPSGVLYNSPGTKTVTFTISDANCTQTSTQTINVNNLPYAEAGQDTTICANRNVKLGGDSVAAGNTYVWFPSNTLDNPFAPNPIASPTASVTTYSVTVTAAGTGCQRSDFVTVTMLNPLSADAGPDAPICLNDSVQLGAGFIEGQFYHWTPSTGLNDISSSNPVAHPTQTTTYTVIVTDTTGCDPITDNVTITVNPLPNANAGPDDTITVGGSIQLIGTGGLQYYWTPVAGLSNAYLFNPVATPDSTTTYVLTVTDVFGCQNTDTMRVVVFNFEDPFWIPSAFTPDGNGHNDVLYVRGGGFLTFEFSIYNRYGELLFFTKNLSDGWDGSSKLTGQESPPDAYVWKLNGVMNDGKVIDSKGLVNLIR